MSLSLPDIAFLQSAPGSRLLEQLAVEDLSASNLLSLITRLRKSCTPAQASAALEMAQLRHLAVEKFGADAARMFFTRSALEQASHPLISRYRAAKVGAVTLVDACCGVGADSQAFAAAGAHVTGVDMDPVRIAIARHNAAVLNYDIQFVQADVTECDFSTAETIFFDPARRDVLGNRISDVERYQPPLSTIAKWYAHHIAVKLSPGVDLAQLSGYSGAVEFISVNGDLKEALLWCSAGLQGTQATLLTADHVLHWLASKPLPSVAAVEPGAWLVEPDPALLRAGLVQDVAARFNAHLLDDTIAYLTSAEKPVSPWLRSWRILDWMPFNLKHLRAYLRDRHIGHVTVKKRGTAVTPETLIPQLKLKGDQHCVLVLTRCRGQQIVLVCADYEAD